jgi:hypothetical protein
MDDLVWVRRLANDKDVPGRLCEKDREARTTGYEPFERERGR